MEKKHKLFKIKKKMKRGDMKESIFFPSIFCEQTLKTNKQKDNKKILFPQKNRSITKTKKIRHCRVPTAIIDSIISKFEESDLDFCLQKKIYCSTAGKVEDRSTF